MEESEIELQQTENFTPLEATQNFALEAAVAAAAVGEQNFTYASRPILFLMLRMKRISLACPQCFFSLSSMTE